MKLILNGNQELANIDLHVDAETGTCKAIVDTLGYRIGGPSMTMAFTKDDMTDGLRLTLDLPGITEAAMLIEKSDVKKVKELMNKDAIKFMVKALM